MVTTPRITPNIWFQGNAGEALEFYLAAFGGDSEILKTVSYRETGLPEFQRDFAGQLLLADFSLDGQWFMAMGSAVDQENTCTEALSPLVPVKIRQKSISIGKRSRRCLKPNSVVGVKIASGCRGRSCHSRWIIRTCWV